MKIKTYKPEPPPFNPVTLEIKLETQEELDRWTSLFNSVKLNKFLTGGSFALYTPLTKIGGSTKHYTEVLQLCRDIG